MTTIASAIPAFVPRLNFDRSLAIAIRVSVRMALFCD
jgi:hypothetical protein